MKAASLRALNYHTSMDGPLREILNELLFKSIAIFHAAWADMLIENERKVYGIFAIDSKMLPIEVERYLLNIAKKTDLQQILKQIFEKKDTIITVTKTIKEGIETIKKRGNKITNMRVLRRITNDCFHLVLDVLSIFNQEKETAKRIVIMEEELD